MTQYTKLPDTSGSSVQSPFSLERFEYLVNNTSCHEESAGILLFLLQQLDLQYGHWGEFERYAPGQTRQVIDRHVCTRIAGAVTTLFSRPSFIISDSGFYHLMGFHRWLALIFAVSGYGNGDHIIRNISGGMVTPLTLNARNLQVFCLSYYPDSQIPLQSESLWQYDRRTVAALFFSLLSGRVLPTQTAHEKREQLLVWFPEKLQELGSLEHVPVSVLHDVYMHCSYADLPQKHEIKRTINKLLRQQMLDEGKVDLPAPREKRRKPVILVIIEWFTCQHSVWRTHSESLKALRSRYVLEGVSLPGTTDEITTTVFDVCHQISGEDVVGQVYTLAEKLRPDMVYFLGVGMFPHTIYLSNLRLAPLQIVGLGHGASTFATCVDYFVVDEDFVGDKNSFSEKVEALPVGAQPFVPPSKTEWQRPMRVPYKQRPPESPLRVAVCASVMKINPGFLSVLAQIRTQSCVPVQFCFYMGFAQGLTFCYLRDVICTVLPDAEVNPHLSIQAYQQALNSCDMFVNPFPYGNMNGVVDVICQGLPGICLTGPELHTHIDGGLFRRLGLPEQWIAENYSDYIAEAVRLAESHDEREQWQALLLSENRENILFDGHPEWFEQAVTRLYSQGEHG
ncbi:cobalt ABC transporter permease [Morganella morganii]|uniref:Cobalt ABC transporter permease n=1 Tax=Morganella morganii TaxID=582 RepID=A0A8I0PZS9_MORMO|nr:cobalt ABC transporter permease [Morganella morganii]MBE8614372.1 cobalt ABC transporter permease [Morganella morganii]